MNKTLTQQMQDFAIGLQTIMAKHIQDTTMKQVEIFMAMQTPITSNTQKITENIHSIMLNKIEDFSKNMRTP